MLKHQIAMHNAQIQKAREIFKKDLSPQALMIIDNMQHIIDELIKDKEELEKCLNEDSNNMIGRI